MEIEKVGLDTGFFLRLLQGNPLAIEIYEQILDDKLCGVVSVIVAFELKRLSLKSGNIVDPDAYSVLEQSLPSLFEIIPLDLELALEAALVSHGTGLPTADAIIYTTYKKAGCKIVYTVDSHFKRVSQGVPQIVIF